MFTLTGTIVKVFPAEQVTEKFKKQFFVVEDLSGTQPVRIPFQLLNERLQQLEAFKPGDNVSVLFSLKGSTIQAKVGDGEVEKWFCNAEAFRIKAWE